jgi:hypothetical protein
MGLRLKVHGGTPIHGERSLCMGCRHAQVVQGQQVSDLRVWCAVIFDNPKPMHRAVVECSDYARKTDQSRKEMEKIAWILETRKGRPIGFVSALEHKYRVGKEDLDEPEED